MESITQLYGVTPDEFKKQIIDAVRIELQGILSNVSNDDSEKLFTRAETAEFLKISMPTLHSWVNKGLIKPYPMGNRIYFRKNEIVQTIINSNNI